MPTRHDWTGLTDSQLLAQSEVDTYRASGPGGQKRNKTSSAVRIRHLPSGLLVIAEESRSQHENRDKALQRLRRAFYLQVRDASALETLPDCDAWHAAHRETRVTINSVKDARFWPAAGVALDVLVLLEAKVSEAASALGVSTGQFVDFLQIDEKVWQHANEIRTRFGHKPLR